LSLRRIHRFLALAKKRKAFQAMVSVPPALTPPISSATIIVPARNEERNIEVCVRSLLNQSYVDYDVVVVDGGSEDATPAILQRLAAESPRLRVVSEPPLPPSWIGQSWALATGAAGVSSEWLLFTDADTEHQPGTLAAAVAFAESQRLDMLSLLYHFKLSSFWERVVLPVPISLSQLDWSPEEVNDPCFPKVKAHGAFILIRRAVYEAMGGHRAIRDVISNDNAMARLIKSRGYRLMLADGCQWVQARHFRSLGEIWTGMSRWVFSRHQVSLAWVLGCAALLLGLSWGSFALAGLAMAWLIMGTGSFGSWLALLLGGLGILLQVALGVSVAHAMRIPSAYGLLRPLGIVVIVGIMLNSAFLILSGRGVTWKGRRYYRAAGDG